MYPQFPCRDIGAGRVRLVGAFRPNSSSGIVSTSYKGIRDSNGKVGYNVVRTSAGLYTITFAQPFNELLAFKAYARVADATATIVQGGDFDSSARTLQVRVLQGGSATGGQTKTVDLPLSCFRPATGLKVLDMPAGAGLPSGATVGATIGGYTLRHGNSDSVYYTTRVPDDWDGSSALTLRVFWHPISTKAVTNGNTVILNIDYTSPAAAALVDASSTTVTPTAYTAGGGDGAAKSLHYMDFTIAAVSITRGDQLCIRLYRTSGADTYDSGDSGDVIILGASLRIPTVMKLIDTLANEGATYPYITPVNGVTDPCTKIVWPAGCVVPIKAPAFEYPNDLDDTATLAVKVLAKMSGATNTPTITVGYFEGIGDTDAGGATAALSSSLAMKSRTIAAADVGAAPAAANILLTPGAHAADAVEIYSAWIEYTSVQTGSTFALADLAADVDNEIMFEAVFRTTNAGK